MNRNQIFSIVSRNIGINPINTGTGYKAYVPFYDRIDGPTCEISANSFPAILRRIRGIKARIALCMIADSEGFDVNDESYETLEMQVEYGYPAADWRSIVRHVANQSKLKN